MGAGVDAYEQWVLELINRARLDPWAEANRFGIDLNKDLAPGTLGGWARQPLAGNDALAAAAAAHSLWMLDTDTFSHTGAGGSDPGQRIVGAGYALTGAWTWGENIAYNGTTGGLDTYAATAANHDGLFRSAGHRLNLLDDGFREIGVGEELGRFGNYNAQTLTEDFATSGRGAFVTGVAFADRDGDRFYSVGEGTGGIGVGLYQNGTLLAGTGTAGAGAGGYAARTSASGSVDVLFSGGGLAHAVDVSVWMDGRNLKIDLVDGGSLVRASTSTALRDGATNLELLGVDDLAGYGNGAGNLLDGNRGANALWGGAGSDTLHGMAGNDALFGGEDGDVLDGGAGDDVSEGGAGNDALSTYEGRDTLRGGDGDDAFYTVPNVAVTIDGGAGYDVAYIVAYEAAGRYVDLASPMYAFTDVEVCAAWMGGGNDTVLGTAGKDNLFGNDGDDFLSGVAGDDVISGGLGNDVVYGGTGNDWMVSSPGADIYHFDHAMDLVAGEFDVIDGFKDAGPAGYDLLVFSSAVRGSSYLYDYGTYGAVISVQVAGGWWSLGLPGIEAARVSDQISFV